MRLLDQIKAADWNKMALILIPAGAALLASGLIRSESYKWMLCLLFAGAVLLLYLRQVELFILFVLILNQEVFYLLPRQPLGSANYQDLLFVVILVTGGWVVLKRNMTSRNISA